MTEVDVLRAVALQAERRSQNAPSPSEPLPVEPASSLPTRLVSLVALVLVVTSIGFGLSAIYHAFTDSFVAPLILSPDSETVVQSKLNLSRLLSEREHLLARIQEESSEIEAADRTIGVLKEIEAVSSRPAENGEARAWDGREELQEILARQKKYVTALEKQRAAGLVHEVDVVREKNALNHVRVALLQEARERLSTRMQLARIDLDRVKAESERRARLAERRASEQELARLDELIADLRQLPAFRAAEAQQDLAFVPYNQLEGVRPGAAVYHCKHWGFFICSQVGKIADLVPGEIIAQDPWGSTARGRYAVLELTDKSAAQSRSLRVRTSGARAAEAEAVTFSR